MSAVMKGKTINPDENADLAVIEPKSLAEILVISEELPIDFFTNSVYDEHIDKAIEASSNLVYSLDESGEKAAKSDATIINKYANKFKSFITATFKRETEEVKLKSDKKNAKVKALLDNRQQLIDQFAEKRQAKLDSIKSLLETQLTSNREELGIKAEFQVKDVDLSSMVKLTGTITDKGKLTTKAVSFIKAIVDGELAHQNKTENRLLLIANKCLTEDIKPPLTGIHLGADLYADDATFEATLSRLVTAELERMDQLKANITKQVEAENQQVLADALAGQQEAAIETVRKEATAQPIETTVVTKYPDISVNTKAAGSAQPVTTERFAEPPADDKKTVIVTAQFRIRVRKNISAQAVANHLADNKLSDELKEALVECSAVDHG